MRPLIFRVRKGSNFELNDTDQLYVIDFQLDVILAWVAIRDKVSLHENQRIRAQGIINHASSFIYNITTDSKRQSRTIVRFDPIMTLESMAQQLDYFSEKQQKKATTIIQRHLKSYL